MSKIAKSSIFSLENVKVVRHENKWKFLDINIKMLIRHHHIDSEKTRITPNSLVIH